ncbi:hypothetical protein F4824DRAFT_517048 [Ustulina deusta]|nr:hypothetical protein F4824DRAFT_517048 [Ustulina deusta]
MFTTFSAQMSPVLPTTSITPPNGASGKRRKVARACDSCRLNRIRCEDDRPCENCRTRGEKCTNTMPWEAHSLPAAKREIERLQDRLRQLQKQQSAASFTERRKSATTNASPPTPPDFPASDVYTKPTMFQQSNRQSIPEANQTAQRQNSPWESYSNSPSSATPTLIHLMGHHSELDRPHLGRGMPTADRCNGSHTTLPRNKERQFLNLFWKGYPWLHPVLEKEEIDHHHDSLWDDTSTGEQKTRLPSPLVDLLLALSMQYGSAFLLRDVSDSTQWGVNSRSGNASLAGQSFCHRSHRLQIEMSQNSTLQSVQCCILSSIYLLNAGSLDRALTALATGVRMAQILGLHETPPFGSTVLKQERLRSNIWRLLIAIDGYYAILLGLPPLIQPIAEERLLMNFWQCAILDETSNDYDRSWESCQSHFTKLILAAQLVHAYFLRRRGELLRQGYGGDLQSPLILESFAESMTQKLEIIRRWAENVPAALKTHRPGGGGPFSVVWVSILDLDPQAPLHLQQQRLSLELGYHHLSLLLIRSFVRFMLGHYHLPQTKQVDAHFVGGLKHAISIISIMNQALTNGDGLTGWLLFFRCQWDATLYLLNYITVYPVGPLTGDTRRSLGTAVETFALMGKYLEMAKSAQKIVEDVLRRDPAHASTELNVVSTNELLVPDTVNSATAVPMPPLSFFMDEGRTGPWDDHRNTPAPTNEFCQGSTTDATQPRAFEPLSVDTSKTAPNAASFTDPFLLDNDLSWRSLAYQDFDDIADMYSVTGDW